MRERREKRLLSIAIVAAAFVARPAVAEADERERCATSAEHAQQLRDEGKYRRAREEMLVCARDVCPAPIKSDCGVWLTELDRDAPTVVFGAHDEKGSDLFDVKVSMDGALLQSRLDGKPVLVDAGEHTFSFESPDGSVRDERLLIRAAEKGRPIIVTFGEGPAGGGAETVGAAEGADVDKRGSIVPSLVVGGIGVAALGSFAYFGLSGMGAIDDLQDCKPNCAKEDVDGARTKLLIADVSLGVGVVAIGVATYLLLTRAPVSAKATTGQRLRLEGGPVAGGGMAGLVGTF